MSVCQTAHCDVILQQLHSLVGLPTDPRLQEPPALPVLGLRPADGAEGDVDVGGRLQGGRAGQDDQVGPGEGRAQLSLERSQQVQGWLEVGVDWPVLPRGESRRNSSDQQRVDLIEILILMLTY